MTLTLPPAPIKIVNRPFKSVGDDRVIMQVDGMFTQAPMLFHARTQATNNFCTLTEIDWPPNDAAAHHLHELEDEAFYVIEGSMTVHTSKGDFTLKAGDLAWGPRGLHHGYTISNEGARVLLIQTPGTELTNYFIAVSNMGNVTEPEDFVEFVRWSGEEYGVHFLSPVEHPPGQGETLQPLAPEEATGPTSGGGFVAPKLDYIVQHKEVKSSGEDQVKSTFASSGTTYKFHLGAEKSGGLCGVIEVDWPADEVVPFHTHTLESMSFYVLEGSLDVVLEDGEVLSVGPNEMAWVPRDVKRALRVGSAGARVVVSYFPGTRIDQLYRLTADVGDPTENPEKAAAVRAWAFETFGVLFHFDQAVPSAGAELKAGALIA